MRPPLTNRQKCWKAMRMKSGAWLVQDIATVTGLKWSYVRSFVTRLMKAGYVRVHSAGSPGRFASYLLVKNTGPRVPVIGHNGKVVDPNVDPRDPTVVAQRAWTAIREMKRFDAEDAATGAGVPKGSVDRFMKRLAKAGLIAVVGRAPHGHDPRVFKYLLVKDIGPIAPRFNKKTGELIDPNVTPGTHS